MPKSVNRPLDPGTRSLYVSTWHQINDRERTELYSMGAFKPEDLWFVDWSPTRGYTFRGRDLTIEEKNAFQAFRQQLIEEIKKTRKLIMSSELVTD